MLSSIVIPQRIVSGPGGFYNAAGTDEKNEQAKALADVRGRYPYPPKDCDSALLQIQNLNNEIKKINENIASGVTNRVGKRYLTASNIVITELQNWVNGRKCIEAAIKHENDGFAQALDEALAKETTYTENKNKKDNLVIFGAIGLLAAGTLFFILRK